MACLKLPKENKDLASFFRFSNRWMKIFEAQRYLTRIQRKRDDEYGQFKSKKMALIWCINRSNRVSKVEKFL
jgi:hypothetical protein